MKKHVQVIVGLLAFVTLLLFTAAFILNLLKINASTVTYIGYGFALAVVLITAKYYVDKLSMTWKVIFYVIEILAIVDYFLNIF